SEAMIQAVYPPSRHVSVKVRTFLDLLAGRLKCEDAKPAARPLILNAEPFALRAGAVRQRPA
ncbi:MAG TPA: hypothetical protein VF502_05115, partial [Stellaceae bacterium]